jgi:hypothetical protein
MASYMQHSTVCDDAAPAAVRTLTCCCCSCRAGRRYQMFSTLSMATTVSMSSAADDVRACVCARAGV